VKREEGREEKRGRRRMKTLRTRMMA